MAKFYVFRGKKALWNLLLVVMAILALIYVFRGDDNGESNDIVENEMQPAAALVTVEPVTVRPIPTKFSDYKLERERLRSRQLEFLQNVAYDAETASERKTEAQLELQAYIEKMGRETEIENLLRAKGYLDGLVIMDKESITVVVPVTLTREEVARIGELVHRMTGINMERITIVDEAVSV